MYGGGDRGNDGDGGDASDDGYNGDGGVCGSDEEIGDDHDYDCNSYSPLLYYEITYLYSIYTLNIKFSSSQTAVVDIFCVVAGRCKV